MIVAIVVNEIRPARKMLVAVLAVIVVRTLHPVFFETPPRREVYTTVIAEIVTRGVANVLTVSIVGGEITIAAIAVAHF